MRQKTLTFIDKLSSATHLDPKRIMKIYTFILFFAPLAYLVLLEVQATGQKETIFKLLSSSPLVTISLITAAGDFVLGYLCWLNGKKLLDDRASFHKFMKIELFSQLLACNWICLIFAIFGVRLSSDITEKNTSTDANRLISLAYVTLFLSIICFVFMMILAIKTIKG